MTDLRLSEGPRSILAFLLGLMIGFTPILLEASRRGYWKSDKETIEKLEEEYLKTEEILEEEIGE